MKSIVDLVREAIANTLSVRRTIIHVGPLRISLGISVAPDAASELPPDAQQR